jgi:hypothetical protein
MIDIESEHIIPVRQVPEHVPSASGGESTEEESVVGAEKATPASARHSLTINRKNLIF